MTDEILTRAQLNKLIGRLVRVHGVWCMGSEEHFAMFTSWKLEENQPLATVTLFPENHECITIEHVPFFKDRQEAMNCTAEVTAYRLPRGRKQ
jgi:hypothetical protein